jgi:hypothetical protein
MPAGSWHVIGERASGRGQARPLAGIGLRGGRRQLLGRPDAGASLPIMTARRVGDTTAEPVTQKDLAPAGTPARPGRGDRLAPRAGCPRGDPPRPGRIPGRCWSAPGPIAPSDRGHGKDQPHTEANPGVTVVVAPGSGRRAVSGLEPEGRHAPFVPGASGLPGCRWWPGTGPSLLELRHAAPSS